MRSFVKIKPLGNGKISLSFIDIGKSCLNHKFLTSLSFKTIRKNKILAKVSEFYSNVKSDLLTFIS